MRHARFGMSLVEVTVSLGIFMTVMVVVLESQTATQRFSATTEAQDDLNAEGLRVLDEISTDLISSGWQLPHASGSTAPESPSGASYTDAADDRSIRYYPYVQLQQTASTLDDGLGQQFQHTWRTGSLIAPVIPVKCVSFLTGLPSDNVRRFGLTATQSYRDSYFARSQEIIFLKSTVADWDYANDQPAKNGTSKPALSFGGSRQDWLREEATAAEEEAKRKRTKVLYASGWAPKYVGTEITGYEPRKVYTQNSGVEIGTALNIPYGVVMESGYLSDLGNDLSAIEVNWRTQDGGGYTPAQQATDNLMEYMYAVTPSRTGLGALVRAHSSTTTSGTIPSYPQVGAPISKTSTRAMIAEKILSDNVVRIVFDTWRTVDQQSPVPDPYEVTTLDVNMVRVRVYMARRIVASDMVLTRVLDRVVTMRARNSFKDKNFDEAGSSAATLGRSPIGIAY